MSFCRYDKLLQEPLVVLNQLYRFLGVKPLRKLPKAAEKVTEKDIHAIKNLDEIRELPKVRPCCCCCHVRDRFHLPTKHGCGVCVPKLPDWGHDEQIMGKIRASGLQRTTIRPCPPTFVCVRLDFEVSVDDIVAQTCCQWHKIARFILTVGVAMGLHQW